MSRTKSIKALLASLPKDIPIEEAQRYFARESACHLRALVANTGKRADFWGKIRVKQDRLSIPPAEERRSPHISRVWSDIVAYTKRISEKEPETGFA